jgi:hypothetical protein
MRPKANTITTSMSKVEHHELKKMSPTSATNTATVASANHADTHNNLQQRRHTMSKSEKQSKWMQLLQPTSRKDKLMDETGDYPRVGQKQVEKPNRTTLQNGSSQLNSLTSQLTLTKEQQ